MSLPNILYVPIAADLYDELVRRYGKPDRKTPVAKLISDVVSDFLDRTEEDFPDIGPKKGYYWQKVFLPNGTRLRMTIHGKQHFAEIEKEEVEYEGKRYSPSSWANHIADHARNAWRDIHVMRPGDSDWIFADTLRRT